ncbi:MAG: cysteine--tRNA ligase [Ignavibacteriales bacterium]|nr:cysteine--tRNA ligase [Ignavibacteriales bacterium]
MSLAVYNTLSRQKEEFHPIQEGRVGMYVCGPTVYGHSHIGHAKSYVSFDLIVRYLRYLGYSVLYVQNITDVGHLTDDADAGEDKIEKQSKRDRIHPMQVVELYTRSYFEDMDAMGLVRPDISPRATAHIIEQIGIVRQLIAAGFAYEANGSVYFDVTKFSEYGKLSGRVVEEMEAGARVEVNSEKKHPADFALWKKAGQEHIMQWESPWGMGFPGWHLECSAMSMKYLGESFDIHGGGLENQFPHHECEIAQSECTTGKQFVKYWLHNNMVTVNGQKMGKSLGNFVTLKQAFEKHDPIVVRFFILQSHYRSPLDFSDAAIEGAGKGLEKLRNTYSRICSDIEKGRSGTGVLAEAEMYKKKFLEAMDDDFNSPQAIAVLFDLSRAVNELAASESGMSVESLQVVRRIFEDCGGTVLGVIGGKTAALQANSKEDGLMDLLIAFRKDAKAEKMWPLADKIRDGLKAIGILLEDSKDGTTWKKIE